MQKITQRTRRWILTLAVMLSCVCLNVSAVEWCVAYAPFRQGQSPGVSYPTEDQINEDLCILRPSFRHVRTYSTTNGFDEIVPSACSLGMKVTPGAWIAVRAGDESPDAIQALDAADRNEVESLISLANIYGNITEVVVGNEVPAGQMDAWIGWINEVKGRVPAGIDVTCAAGPEVWTAYPELVEAVDSIMVNAHPFWGGLSIELAADNLLDTIAQIRETYPGKRIIVGETGWPTSGDQRGGAVPNAENQLQYLTDLTRVLADEDGLTVFIFEAFDQAWKTEPGGVGAYWGLRNTAGQLKNSSNPVPRPPVFGDVDGDGNVGATDVQKTINAALGLPATLVPSIDCDDKLDAVDVQLVINATLGIYDHGAREDRDYKHGTRLKVSN